VRVEDFARAPEPGRSFADWLATLPRILAGPDLAEIARSIVSARRAGRAVVLAMGAHVVKTGMAPILIDLMERGLVTAIAVNGAFAIHDVEIALFGTTSEDVVAGLQRGTFGMARETAAFYNGAIRSGEARGLGAGECLGAALIEAQPPHGDASVVAAAYRFGIPLTVHIALGGASLRDFRILTEAMRGLADGGVLLNIGSAVLLPEVLLKAIALLRNRLGEAFTGFLGVNFDFIQSYRSNQQVVTRVRSIGGRGISLTGHHEILIPLLGQAVVDEATR
jgi:hypothetical protein